jgi:hypothetical protein
MAAAQGYEILLEERMDEGQFVYSVCSIPDGAQLGRLIVPPWPIQGEIEWRVPGGVFKGISDSVVEAVRELRARA